MASVETTRVATERGSVRRADGRGAGRGDQARERDHSRRHERHGASHARVQSRRWPDPPATQASARRDAERARSGRRHLESDAVSAWGVLPDALQFSLRGGRCVISRSVGGGVSTRRARRAVVSTSTSGAQPNARPAGRESPDHRAHTRNVRHASARIQGAVRCQRRAQHTISARTWWCAEPRRGSCTRGEYRLRRATMSSRVIQRLSGANTESRRSSNTSGHSALIVESRAARIA